MVPAAVDTQTVARACEGPCNMSAPTLGPAGAGDSGTSLTSSGLPSTGTNNQRTVRTILASGQCILLVKPTTHPFLDLVKTHPLSLPRRSDLC